MLGWWVGISSGGGVLWMLWGSRGLGFQVPSDRPVAKTLAAPLIPYL